MASCNATEATNDSVHQGVASTTDKENGNGSQQSSQIAQQSVHAQDEGKKDVHTEPEEACEQKLIQLEEAHKQKCIELEAFQQKFIEREEEYKQKCIELEAYQQKFIEREEEYKQKLIQLEEAHKQKCTELEAFQQKFIEREEEYKQKCIELEAYQQKFIEREEEYKQKEERNKITEQKHEQLKQEYAAFHARMASSISTDIHQHSELSENLNDPCRQSELVLKYEDLRLKFLPRIITKPPFQSDDARERIASLVKNTYGKAQEDMTAQTNVLVRCFLDDEGKSNTHMMTYSDIKVKMINLQALALLRRDRSDYMGKIKFLISEEPEILTPFIAQCYKISCLMCLHNPPLVPSWDTGGTAADPDMKIFPPIGAMDNEMDSS